MPWRAECGLALLSRRHHEAKPRRVVGKFGLQVEEVSTGDVRRLEAAAAGDRDIRIIVLRWRRLQIGGAVKDPQIIPAQVARASASVLIKAFGSRIKMPPWTNWIEKVDPSHGVAALQGPERVRSLSTRTDVVRSVR